MIQLAPTAHETLWQMATLPVLRGLPGFAFDKRLAGGGRWRRVLDDGRLGRMVSKNDIANGVRDLHARSGENFQRLGQAMADGRISPATFERAMRAELKQLHVANTALGWGGSGNVSQQAWGRTGHTMRGEYAYLRNFVNEFEAGNLTAAQTVQRAGSYADNAYGRYYDEALRQARDEGGANAKRLITEGDERVCAICRQQASEGWVPIDSGRVENPPIHVGCRCGLDFGYRDFSERGSRGGGSPKPSNDGKPPAPNWRDPMNPDATRQEIARMQNGKAFTEWQNAIKGTPQGEAVKDWTAFAHEDIRREIATLKPGQYSSLTKDFLKGIDTAPQVDGTLWRGIDLGYNSPQKRELIDRYQKAVGTTDTWALPSSMTPDPSIANTFGDVMFQVQSKTGRYIGQSGLGEAEAINMPGTRFLIQDVQAGAQMPLPNGNSRPVTLIRLVEL